MQVHEKTKEENWIPQFDDETGTQLYPELMAELDALKRAHLGSDVASRLGPARAVADLAQGGRG